MQCFYSSIFLSHVLRNFIEEWATRPSPATSARLFLSHVLRNFIEEAKKNGESVEVLRIPEPCAQELH